MVSFRCVIVNRVHKSDDMDDGDNNNNSVTVGNNSIKEMKTYTLCINH